MNAAVLPDTGDNLIPNTDHGPSRVYTFPEDTPTRFRVRNLNVQYGKRAALQSVSLDIPQHRVIAVLGPSHCGKSTLLRCFNRMNDLLEGVSIEGEIFMNGQDILRPGFDVFALRREVGLIFPQPNPLPKSIFDNSVYGIRLAGVEDRGVLEETAERVLRETDLWEDVRDRLHESALTLSHGQMQRLCIARALALNPAVLLLDEPCDALEPAATIRIEQIIHRLKGRITMIIATQDVRQAARVADYTAFLYMGELVEFNDTRSLFTNPSRKKTEDYITGRFG